MFSMCLPSRRLFFRQALRGHFGRRFHRLDSALAYYSPGSFSTYPGPNAELFKWLDIITRGLFQIFTGRCMGILYDEKEEARRELQEVKRDY